MSYEILRGDCLAVLRTLPDASFDSIVTDPPYELGFMGKAWDATGIANSVDVWREALRVLKPGGHLLAFSGSRTYHRMTCAIEDAGFEIRDQMQWIYGSGFPKSNNLDKLRGSVTCGCMVQSTHDSTPASGPNESAPGCATGEKPSPEHDLHDLLGGDVPAPVDTIGGGGQVLQPGLPEQSAPGNRPAHGTGKHEGREQPCVEGRGDNVQAEGQLQGHSVHSGAASTAADGAGGRLRNGASGGDGAVVRVSADANGSGASRRPRSGKQPAQQPGTVADQQRTQAPRAWPDCARCGLPVVPQGLGTALKPAHEPICVARKPLIGTVAANVLAHGVGALNIDGCRVPAEKATGWGGGGSALYEGGLSREGGEARMQDAGRWPANLIHDGSDEVLAAFPDAKGQQGAVTGNEPSAKMGATNCFGKMDRRHEATPRIELDTSAARFFYCAKASRKERDTGTSTAAETYELLPGTPLNIVEEIEILLDPLV